MPWATSPPPRRSPEVGTGAHDADLLQGGRRGRSDKSPPFTFRPAHSLRGAPVPRPHGLRGAGSMQQAVSRTCLLGEPVPALQIFSGGNACCLVFRRPWQSASGYLRRLLVICSAPVLLSKPVSGDVSGCVPIKPAETTPAYERHTV